MNNSRVRGFYRVNGKIFYGEYFSDQVSGRMKLSAAKPEMFRTDVPHTPDDYAALLKDNHAMTDAEFSAMESALKIITECSEVCQAVDVDFSETEKRLGITLPKELKILYSYLNRTEYFSDSERFLPLDELYTDDSNLVFYKIKRTPAAVSLDSGTLMRYYKKRWIYDEGGEGFLCYALNRVVVKTIMLLPFIRKAKIGGEFRTMISPQKKIAEIFGERFKVLEEYDNYGNIVLYSENGALGWFRQNGFYADIMMGCKSNELLNELAEALPDAEWE